jgi:hypothetical protein
MKGSSQDALSEQIQFSFFSREAFAGFDFGQLVAAVCLAVKGWKTRLA